MFISVFDLFKISIGPSSSHTMGPMVAAGLFLKDIEHFTKKLSNTNALSLRVLLHGSLAYTGKGHATDLAIILGLAGEKAETLDIEMKDQILKSISTLKHIQRNNISYAFDPDRDIVFDYENLLPYHTNGMTFQLVKDKNAIVFEKIYYSIGGGFVLSQEEAEDTEKKKNHFEFSKEKPDISVPYPFASAEEMLLMAKESNLSIAQMKRANEEVFLSREDVNKGLDKIWETMDLCIKRGLERKGILPGGLNIERRAYNLHQKLQMEWKKNTDNPFLANDWLSLFALAVNEENASGGRIVTAPTNGAAGVVPAVLKYYSSFYAENNQEFIRNFLLTSSAIGGLIKYNASISGAEIGCQGEIGSASSMAAAGFVEALGGSAKQVENAAEIALEHHLGMTCDPIAGLVQVPCIERNAFGAVKAVTSASLAMHGTGNHFVPLDACIETMRQTGLDMESKYKETSQGGLAVNVVDC